MTLKIINTPKGIYNGKQAHSPDVEHVLKRANDIGVEKIVITAGYLEGNEQ